MTAPFRKAWKFVVRCAKAAKTLMTDKRLPLWLRGMFVVMFGVTQVLIGPIDDFLLLIPFGITFLRYRHVLTDAWQTA